MSYSGQTAPSSQSMLGRYRLTREIARSNDIVWEGIDPQVNRRVAVKELALDPSLTGVAKRQRIERFYREARAAGTMNHPNIVTIYEVGEDRGRYFIAMEFLEGQTLRDRLQVGGAVPIQEAVQITTALCDALQYAHERGVIHRDIKPDNIFLLRPDNRVKLADFGIARITGEQQLTVAGQIFGTPSYMSPEQVLGKEIDARSDIFALGIVLYEMVTGRKPFVGDSVVTITYRIMNDPTPAVLGASPSFDSVIQRATAKNPADRYSSATEFRTALLAAASAERTGQSLPPHVAPPIPYPVQGGVPQSTAMYGTATQQNLGGAIAASVPLSSPLSAPIPPIMPPPPMGTAQQGLYVPEPAAPRNYLGILVALAFAGLVLFGAGWAFTTAFSRFSTQSKQATTSNEYEKAAALYSAQRYEEAIPLFRSVRENNFTAMELRGKSRQGEAWSYRALGQRAMDSRDYKKAIDLYTAALALTPDDSEAQKGLAAARRATAIATTGSTNPADDPANAVPPPPSTVTPASGGNAQQGGAFAGTNTNEWQAANQQRANAAQNALGQGNTLYQQGNVKDACKAWNDARMAGPGSPAGIEAGRLYSQYCQQFTLFGN
jgi:serine/threonine-protein kinase